MTWTVGSKIWNGAAIYTTAGVKVVSGTATIQYILEVAGVANYLQDDLTTVSATVNTIDISYVGGLGAHAHLLTIPESMRGLRGEMVVLDPTSGFEYREDFMVSESALASGAGSIVIIPDG